MKMLQWITVMLLILVTGVFWGTWFTLTRTIDAIPPESFILIGKTIIRNVAIPMSIIMPATILCLVVLLWRSVKFQKVFFNFSLATLILFVLALVITVGIEVPIDNQIKTWTISTIPSNWETLRAKWEFYHTLRTFISIAATGCFIAGILKKPAY
ncbi:MAG TPA: DUF1772 domain-containing protein [Flavisolibacter sp.]|nr:DUF1772 domain-containing protein [Flavisolibacter sp.]